MRLFDLVAAWLFPCVVCATTIAPADSGTAEPPPPPSPLSGPSSPSALSSFASSTGDQLGSGTSRQERSRSVSPPCFGARSEETAERRTRKNRSPPPRSTSAANGSVSSNSAASTSSPPSSLGDRLALTTSSPERACSASPPLLGAHGGGRARARSPEEAKGRLLASYLRKVSRRLARPAMAPDEKSPRTTAAGSALLIGEVRRNDGSAIATEEEIRAFVIASASHARTIIPFL